MDWKIQLLSGEHETIAENQDGVPIPKGFTHVEGTTEETGLVIKDANGNEFVWVPVENTRDFITLKYGWSNDEQEWKGIEPAILTGYDDEKYGTNVKEATYTTLEAQFNAEYNAMVTSVKKYGGFYVGRYETSWDKDKIQVASVGGVKPLRAYEIPTNSNWNNQSDTAGQEKAASWYGLYKFQKELYNDTNSSVQSGMIYGCQWDAIVTWMENVPNNDSSITDNNLKFFIKNSTGMGWYTNNSSTGNPNNLTGLDLNGGSNKVNNIYDLAGNFFEWTQEAYIREDGTGFRIARGGWYKNNGLGAPSSARHNNDSVPTWTSGNYYTSRLMLYIK